VQYSYTEMDVVGGNPRGDYRVDKLLVPEWVDQGVLRNWASALNVITFCKNPSPPQKERLPSSAILRWFRWYEAIPVVAASKIFGGATR